MRHVASRLLFLSFLSLTAAVGSAVAEEGFRCDRSKSLSECYSAAIQRAKELKKKAEDESKTLEDPGKVGSLVEAKAAPATTAGTPGSLFDFLPSFLGALGIDGLSESDGNLNFDRVFSLNNNWRVDLGLTAFTDPEVFEPLEKALPDEIREDRTKTLSEDIGDFDKVDFRFMVTREDSAGERRYGRDVRDYADLFEIWRPQIIAAAVDRSKGTPINTWRRQQAIVDLSDEQQRRLLNDKLGVLEEDPAFGEEKIAQFEKQIVQVANDMIKLASDVDKSVGQIDDLIANQPQAFLEVKYRQRDALTGPDELSGRLCYEVGMTGNINDMMRWARNHPAQCPATASGYPSFDCMAKYLGQNPKSAENSNRLAVVIEYSDADPFDFELPDDSFTFNVKATEKWVGSLTYGRYFPNFSFLEINSNDGSSEDGTRFDLEAKYEDVTGDPMRQSRFVATATFSQRMGKTTLFSISAVYANKPEYLGEVDEEVSARFGLKWKRNPSKGDS